MLKDVVEGLLGRWAGRRHVAWKTTEKPQPAERSSSFRRPDAPNVNGARDVGLRGRPGNGQAADLSALRTAIVGTRQSVCMWSIRAGRLARRRVMDHCAPAASGALPLLIVQGVVMSDLAAAADIVLPGAPGSRRTRSTPTIRAACRAASRRSSAAGEAMEDWQILAGVGPSPRVCPSYQTSRTMSGGDCRGAARTAYADADKIALRAAGSGAQLAAGVEPVRTVEVGLPVSGPAAGEGSQRSDGRRGREPFIPLKPVG